MMNQQMNFKNACYLVGCSLLWICGSAGCLFAQGESYTDVFFPDPAVADLSASSPALESSTGEYVVHGAFGDLLKEIAQCRILEDILPSKMEKPPIYQLQGQACRQIDSEAANGGSNFADPDCRQPFIQTSFARFCRDHLLATDHTKNQLGNPAAWTNLEEIDDIAQRPWTLSPGHQMQLSVIDQTKNNSQPFLKQVAYSQAGDCSLGMHIYTRDPAATDRKPVMVLHGGGWRLRGPAAIAGIETIVPHLTERGYIVFAPFHRLLDDVDGPESCRNAKGRDLLDDVSAARDWIFDHGTRFGMDQAFVETRRLSVIGQSSGAHLAGYLSTQNPAEIERALLLYPATDFGFLIQNIQPGGLYENSFIDSRERLQSFIAQEGISSARELDPNTQIVTDNSFPTVIDEKPDVFPPFFLIHGMADTTVPVEMSSRLCQALNPTEKPADDGYAGERSRSCGAKSEMRLIAGADHILDLRCITGDMAFLAQSILGNSFCPAGGKQGAEEARDALLEAYDLF